MFRPISTEGFDVIEVPATFGPAPALQWIEIKDLVVDDSYQRSINKAGTRNIATIAANFDWRKFAPVVVSPVEGGGFAIVDGQHRTTAAGLAGITKVPCQVIMADRAEQARSFAAINGQVTKVTRLQLFKSKLAAGDPDARKVQWILDTAGVVLVWQTKAAYAMAPNECTSVAMIENLFSVNPGKADLLILALRCLQAGARNQGGALAGIAIQGAFNVISSTDEERSSQDWLAAFSRIDILKILADAQRDAKLDRRITALCLFEAGLLDAFDATSGGRND